MKPGRLLPVLAALLLLVSCGDDSRRNAERTLRETGATELRRDAAAFYKNLFVSSSARYFLPRPDKCPPSFQRFKPLRVRGYPDGFAIAIRERRGLEEGFYVIPLGMDHTPGESRSSHFQKIEDGLYWYQFTD